MSRTPRTRFTATSLALVLLAACTSSEATDPVGDSAGPRTLEVCKRQCSFSELAPALAEANDGDTIEIGPGTYEGGITIEPSVQIVGAGFDKTIISGGGPVVTVGVYEAADQPTVTIDGVTITGGFTRSSGVSIEGAGKEGVTALGGGVEIPQGAGRSLGATVTITNSVITDNRVAPSRTVTSPSGAECPGGPCPFAQAAGGGIDSWGTLTLEHTRVGGNAVGAVPGVKSLSSDAQGGGIVSWLGDLTIVDSTISHNEAIATPPNGRWAEGGGIFLPESGTLTIRDSAVTNNVARLEASFPASVEMLAQPGGIFVGEGATSVTISGTRIGGNEASMTNTVGDATAFAGGINVWGVDFEMRDSVIANNHVIAETIGHSRGDAAGDGGGAELVGRITDTEIVGNTVTARSRAGDATAAIGGLLHEGSMDGGSVSDNRIMASSPRGSVLVFGAGVVVGADALALRNTTVGQNGANGRGRRGSVRGAGIYDGPAPWGEGSGGGSLKLMSSSVTDNVVKGEGLTLRGGGLYIEGERLVMTDSELSGNAPDQCFGCR